MASGCDLCDELDRGLLIGVLGLGGVPCMLAGGAFGAGVVLGGSMPIGGCVCVSLVGGR